MRREKRRSFETAKNEATNKAKLVAKFWDGLLRRFCMRGTKLFQHAQHSQHDQGPYDLWQLFFGDEMQCVICSVLYSGLWKQVSNNKSCETGLKEVWNRSERSLKQVWKKSETGSKEVWNSNRSGRGLKQVWNRSQATKAVKQLSNNKSCETSLKEVWNRSERSLKQVWKKSETGSKHVWAIPLITHIYWTSLAYNCMRQHLEHVHTGPRHPSGPDTRRAPTPVGPRRPSGPEPQSNPNPNLSFPRFSVRRQWPYPLLLLFQCGFRLFQSCFGEYLHVPTTPVVSSL